jgi:hypothetical protein
MKEYNIYGIGGALVDTEVRVSYKFLADAKIDKGVMTLVDESRQRELVEALGSKSVVDRFVTQWSPRQVLAPRLSLAEKLQTIPMVSSMWMILIRQEWTSTLQVKTQAPRVSAWLW